MIISLHLILADSELETVPEEISSDKSIQKKAKRKGRMPTEIILDSNYHHESMRTLEDSDRRGRPDIVHVCLLTALDSPLNREGHLRMYVHTRHDEVIEVEPETRIPRSYNRFVGLMEQLFITGGVPPKDPLLKLFDERLEERIKNITPEKVITFKKEGEQINRRELFRGLCSEDDVCALIGGFPRGDFLSNVENLSDEIVKIYHDELDASTVVGHVIQFYEEEFLSHEIF